MTTYFTLTLSLIYLSFLYGVSPSTPAAAMATAPAATPTNPYAINFIKASCYNITLYGDVCFSSLKPYAWKIGTSPRLMAMMALSVSVKWAKDAEKYLDNVAKYHSLTTRENATLKDCMDQVRSTVSQLTMSAREMKNLGLGRNSTFRWHLSNLQTWVSAALTNEYTCVDGFKDLAQESDVRSLVEDCIEKVVKLTSNALALCNRWGNN